MAAIAQLDQKSSKENMVHDRGQFWPQPAGQTLDQGRVGWQASVPNQPLILTGTLVDAGCEDRSELNLTKRPESVTAAAPAETAREKSTESARRAEVGYAQPGGTRTNTEIASHGIAIDEQTVQSERADIMPHQVPDMRSRMDDPTCAITGATRGYALLLDDGRLLNLNEGGNTMADEGVQNSAAGRAMLNGSGPGVKPRVTLKGWVEGPRVVVEQILKLG